MGTPRYMSPEQWGGSKYASPQSDPWSLAVMAFHCLSGRLPFEAGELPALMMRVTTQPPASLRGFVPSLPESLERVILRALDRDPTQRHASVRWFAHALLPFASPAARARWSAEFGDEATVDRSVRGEASAPVVAATMDSGPPPIPDTLDASSKRVPPPPSPPRRSFLVAFAAGGVGLLAAAVVFFGRVYPAPNAAEPSRPGAAALVATTPTAASAVVVPAPVVERPAVVAPAGPVDAGVAVPAVGRPPRPHQNRLPRHRPLVI